MSANDEHMSLLHRIAGKPPNGGAASVVQRVGYYTSTSTGKAAPQHIFRLASGGLACILSFSYHVKSSIVASTYVQRYTETGTASTSYPPYHPGFSAA